MKVVIDGRTYIVFKDEEEAELNTSKYPNYKRFACVGGYFNALEVPK